MPTQQDLDNSLAQFIADVKAEFAAQLLVINAAVQAIINKIAAGGTPIDTTAELATIAQADADFKTNIDAIAPQLPTTPTPATPSTTTGGSAVVPPTP